MKIWYRRTPQGAEGGSMRMDPPDRHDRGWPRDFEGTVLTPLGYVTVHAFWMRVGLAFDRFEQHILFGAFIDGQEVVARMKRPASRAITCRGSVTMAHRWIQKLHEEVLDEQ